MGNPWLDEGRARSWQPPPGPWREEHLQVLLALAGVRPPRRMLDLGSGVGDVGARFLERFPHARLTCVDGAPTMLARCRERLAAFGDRAAFAQADLGEDWSAAVGDGYDLVLALQSIHHLETASKRVCFARVHDALAPGGLFLLQERLAFDPRLWPHVRALWARCPGLEPGGEASTYEAWLAAEREGGDHPETLEAQVGWLRSLGFDPVETFARYADRVVVAAWKPASGGAEVR